MPAKCIKPLPSVQHLVWASGNYLAALRHEWFVLFDMLAELQHNTIPLCLDSRCKVPIRYTRAKQQCKYPTLSADSAADLMMKMRDSVPPLNLENSLSAAQGYTEPPNKVTQDEDSTPAAEKAKAVTDAEAFAYANAAAAFKAKQEAEANAAVDKKKKADEALFAAAAAKAEQEAKANAAADKKKKADEAKAAAAALLKKKTDEQY